MVSTPYYNRLQDVANLSEDGLHDLIGYMISVKVNLNKARDLVSKVKENPGISGEVKRSIEKRLDEDIASFDRNEKDLDKLQKSHRQAREAIAKATEVYKSLSPDLLSPVESGLLNVTKEVNWMGVLMPVEKYLEGVEQQKNQERELLALQTLNTMNNELKSNGFDVTDPSFNNGIPHSDSDMSNSGGSGSGNGTHGPGQGGGAGGQGSYGGGSGSAGSLPGGAGGGAAGSLPPGAGVGAAVGAGAAAPAISRLLKPAPGQGGIIRQPSPGVGSGQGRGVTPGGTSPGVGGSGSEKPRWPEDALKYPIGGKVTPDGPVGGYIPAPVTDIDDPRWRSDFSHPALGGTPNPTKASGIVGGLVGSGAGALAARGAGGLGGVGGAAGMAGGVMMPPGMGAAGAGMGTAGTVGSGTGAKGGIRGSSSAASMRNSAMRSAGGAGGAGAKPGGAGGRAGGAGPMGMAGAHGGAGGRSRDDKKSRKLMGYKAVRIDDETTEAIDSSAFGAGDASSLKPMKTDDQDKW